MKALDDAVVAGKVLHVGISDTPAWVVAQANTLALWRNWSPFVVLQARYNLLSRDAERDLHPIVGVSRLKQLEDNLGAADIMLTDEAMASLEAATGFDIGFPHDFIRDMQSFVYGEAGALVDGLIPKTALDTQKPHRERPPVAQADPMAAAEGVAPASESP